MAEWVGNGNNWQSNICVWHMTAPKVMDDIEKLNRKDQAIIFRLRT